MLYLTGVDNLAGTVGVSGLSTGDTKAQAEAVFRWAAAQGGFGGRPAKVHYEPISAQDAVNNNQAAQQSACAALTQDQKVRYVVTLIPLLNPTMDCLTKAGVSIVNDASALTTAQMNRYSRFFAAPGDFSADRVLTRLIDDLWDRGWLTSASKVGTFTYDTPDFNALVDGPVTAALRGHGLTIASKRSVSKGAAAVSQASNVALQYRAAGVDRVIPVFASPLFLMNAASSQNYQPHYALYSFFGPGALLESAAPRDQLTGAAGIGWQPFLDIGAGTKPGPVSKRETLCFQLMKDGGQSSTSTTVKGFQVQLCNAIFYLKVATDRLPALPGDLLAAVRPLIGTTYEPADTFRSDVSTRPDGAAGYRRLTFDDNCSCFQYTSPVRAAA